MADDRWNDAPPAARKRGWGKVLLLLAGGCLAVVVGCGGMCAAIFGMAQSAMRQTAAYDQALARARADPDVMAAFGGSLEAGYFVQGNVNVKNDGGNADITIPVSGPAGDGTIHVVATKEAGVWSIDSLVVTKEAQTWDLTPSGAAAP